MGYMLISIGVEDFKEYIVAADIVIWRNMYFQEYLSSKLDMTFLQNYQLNSMYSTFYQN